MSELEAFSETYAEARHKFVEAARGAGATLESHRHPSEVGPEGEPLFLDVAVLGAPDASRVFAVGSGTHGIEGFTGSAAQGAWLSGRPQLPEGTAVVLFHAQNPWGFAHKTRVTEENVDLNRNFVDFTAPLPTNAGYDELHPHLTVSRWDEETLAGIFAKLDAFRERVGEKAFSDAFTGGQYAHADGLFYGGARQQWANRAFRAAVEAHLSRASRVGYVDLHTGMGPWGDHVFLCFHPEGSAARERARAWWGERAVNLAGVTHKKVATYSGTVVDALETMLPRAEVTCAVVEFGTLERRLMQRASFAQRWLRFEKAPDAALAAQLRRDYEAAFYPDDPAWRRAALEHAKELIDRGVAGLRAP